LPTAARMTRWGHFGLPVLIFPTAGGDSEEIERFQLVASLGHLIDQGRIKVYSVDGLATRAWLSANQPPQACARLQEDYDTFIYGDVLQRIRVDCKAPQIEPILAGAAYGAYFAISGICRHPDAFRAAIGLSGIYDLAGALSTVPCQDLGTFAPVEALPKLKATQLEQLRRRKIALGSGQGDYEKLAGTQKMAAAFDAAGVPCKLSVGDAQQAHTWLTWRAMLPGMLAEQI
jgi:esterase/lipase superfamily enzyme